VLVLVLVLMLEDWILLSRSVVRDWRCGLAGGGCNVDIYARRRGELRMLIGAVIVV